jgi:hypothetical protein
MWPRLAPPGSSRSGRASVSTDSEARRIDGPERPQKFLPNPFLEVGGPVENRVRYRRTRRLGADVPEDRRLRWLPDHQAESMRETTNGAQIGAPPIKFRGLRQTCASHAAMNGGIVLPSGKVGLVIRAQASSERPDLSARAGFSYRSATAWTAAPEIRRFVPTRCPLG